MPRQRNTRPPPRLLPTQTQHLALRLAEAFHREPQKALRAQQPREPSLAPAPTPLPPDPEPRIPAEAPRLRAAPATARPASRRAPRGPCPYRHQAAAAVRPPPAPAQSRRPSERARPVQLLTRVWGGGRLARRLAGPGWVPAALLRAQPSRSLKQTRWRPGPFLPPKPAVQIGRMFTVKLPPCARPRRRHRACAAQQPPRSERPVGTVELRVRRASPLRAAGRESGGRGA